MKIIQANVWHAKLGQQVIDFLKAEAADFACLQEVNDLDGRAGTKRFATLEEIKASASLPYSYMQPAYSFRFMERELHFGNAILSRHPIVSSETVFTHGEYKANFDIKHDDGNIRNLQHISVEASGQTLHILNHHGYHLHESKRGNEITMQSMQIIADVIDRLNGPVILCGDFNLVPESESIGVINRRLINLTNQYGIDNTLTELDGRNIACDYIFVNDQVHVKNFARSDALISDHYPLVLEFEL